MSSPDIVVLDTRSATDKASFLTAAARDLQFGEYFGGNWDAFEECLRDFAAQRGPVLVVWTGAAGLPASVRETAMTIFDDALPTGADVLVVDDVSAPSQPDFAPSEERVAIPAGGLTAAQQFWRTVGLHVQATSCSGEALVVNLVEIDPFVPGVGPEIAVADLPGLRERLAAAGHDPRGDPHRLDVSDPHGTLITFIAY